MEATAYAKFARIAPRKARVIANLVRGKNVAQAVSELKFTRRSAAGIVAKLLDSAIANARVASSQGGTEVDLDALFVKTIFVDKAPNRFMRRWRPRAQGRATQVTKGVSHITLIVSDVTAKKAAKLAAAPTSDAPEGETKTATPSTKKKAAKSKAKG